MLFRNDDADRYTDAEHAPGPVKAYSLRTPIDPAAKMAMPRAPGLTIAKAEPREIESGPADTIPGTITGSNPVVAVGAPVIGYVSGPSDVDMFRFDVVAGQTYLIDLRGAGADPIGDPLLKIFDGSGNELGFDDDGGHVLAALYTYTATATGPIYLGATAFWDHGAYEMKVVLRGADEDATSRPELTVGTTYGFLTSYDSDLYSIYLEAGRYYQFQVSGSTDYSDEDDGIEPGELDTFINLFDPSGRPIAYNDDENFGGGDLGSGIGFVVETSGYYNFSVDAEAAQQGGYTIDVASFILSELDPLDSIDWGTQLANPQNITVYFAKAGETFAGDTSIGWTAYEMQQAMLAFQQYKDIINITISTTDKADGATFKLVLVDDPEGGFAGRMYPPGGPSAGVGTFNIASAWDRDGPSAGTRFNGALEKGGAGFQLLLHEFGHGFGLAHPHDDGGTSSTMLGVFGDTGSYGVYDLNQGIYTTMSYNSGWERGPDGRTPGFAFGFESTPSPLDMAVLQRKYGAAQRNGGDSIYELDGSNSDGAAYETIWDTGGNDTIVNNSSQHSIIDLTAATLDYSRTGGGALSSVSAIRGGFVIANGVVIENATGGTGPDTIIGNAAANFIDLRRGGTDMASGGAGDDAFYFGASMTGADRVDGGAGQDQIGLQGNYASLILAAETMAGVETLALLSGTETRFGDAGAGANTRYSYAISTVDGNVAAGQRLVVQAGLLVAGESFAFNGEAETDGTFLVYGGKGQDVVIGGQQSDGFYFGDGAFSAGDRVIGSGGGNDQLGLRGDYSAGIVFAANAIEGVETLVFLSGADVRFGGAASGYSYKVTMDDANVAAGATMTINGTLLSQSEKLTFDGSNERDASFRILSGKSGDSLIGGAGADLIYGGLGADTINGGAGKDSFLYRSVAESTAAAPDSILLFEADDLIDLSAIDANSQTADNDTFAFIGAGAFTGVAGQLRAYQEGSGWVVAGDVNGDGVADFLINLTTAQGQALGTDDFLF